VDKNILTIKRLIWICFWLLIVEGALRKWVIPQLSVPLLLVRDPLVILAYFLAFRSRIFPNHLFVRATLFLAFIFFPAGLIATVFSDVSNVAVVLFGLRTDFLYLPFIFLIPKVFTIEDVIKVGRYFLILSLPMAALMVLQFYASPDSFLNRGAGGEQSRQIVSALGRIRPAGTFSFIVGPVFFYSLVSAFSLYGFFRRGTYSTYLLVSAAIGILIAMSVGGSRSLVLNCSIVLAAYFLGSVLRPRMIGRSFQLLSFLAVIALCLSLLPFVNDGLEVTGSRFEVANRVEDPVQRIFIAYTDTYSSIDRIPPLGIGLGLGTNGGAGLLGATGMFLLAENEWPRVIRESGPFLGTAYIVLRILLVFWIGRMALRVAGQDNLLPLLLYSACFQAILSGQFGQPTELGFATFAGGICLAAMQVPLPQVTITDENSFNRQLSAR
jgi:hypothetical protein